MELNAFISSRLVSKLNEKLAHVLTFSLKRSLIATFCMIELKGLWICGQSALTLLLTVLDLHPTVTFHKSIYLKSTFFGRSCTTTYKLLSHRVLRS